MSPQRMADTHEAEYEGTSPDPKFLDAFRRQTVRILDSTCLDHCDERAGETSGGQLRL